VVSPALAAKMTRGSLTYRYLVTAELGALYQTQIHLEVAGPSSPVIAFGDRDVILFVVSGSGTVNISGREFEVRATDGVYVRPAEAMQLTATPGATLQVFALAAPLGDLQWPANLPHNFDAAYPQRVVSVDAEQRTAMGPRYFQILVDKRIGSKVITQFIGHIPPSKAAPHRHLYEEAIIVLSGEGCMWTEDRRVNVRAGDVIFLPRKQLHSLEATSAEGIDVVGVICPGDNPSINYYD
jgi:mannose-6-phosphate isomerase-like protein (cupin superfamily)